MAHRENSKYEARNPKLTQNKSVVFSHVKPGILSPPVSLPISELTIS